jgi:hypothetical protein
VVELMVADRVELEAKAVGDLDGGPIVEEGGDERAGTGEIAGGDDDVGRILALELGDVGGEVVDAADRDGGGLRVGSDFAGGFRAMILSWTDCAGAAKGRARERMIAYTVQRIGGGFSCSSHSTWIFEKRNDRNAASAN